LTIFLVGQYHVEVAPIFNHLWAAGAVLWVVGCGVNVNEPIGRGAEPSAGAANAGAGNAGDRASSTLSEGLLAHWKLDEPAADAVASDSAAGLYPAVPVSAPASDVAAPLFATDSASRAFDGRSQYLLIENRTELSFSGTVTLSAWVRLTALTDGCQYVLAHGYCWQPPGEVALRVGSPTCGPGGAAHYWAVGAWLNAEHSAILPIDESDLNEWTQLVGTYDGRAWRLYRNGEEVAIEVSDVGAVPVESNWAIGARAPGVGACVPVPAERFFNGSIDDVRIYRRALDAAEVRELYHY
jgi:hypothetical protein